MVDATWADPLNLTIEDIISLPLKNSMSAHSTKGVSGLQYKRELEDLLKTTSTPNPEK